jgi:C4-dicarboxylate transporter DctQ subunit
VEGEMLAKAFDRVLAAGAVASAVLLFADALLTTVAVISRYLFNQPFGWYVEIVEYSLIWITFLSTAWLLKHGGHVKIELVTQHIRNLKLKLAMRLLVRLIIVIVGATLTAYGVIVMVEMIHSHVIATKILSIPRWIITIPIPVGSLLLSIEGLRQLLSLFHSKPVSLEETKAEPMAITQL